MKVKGRPLPSGADAVTSVFTMRAPSIGYKESYLSTVNLCGAQYTESEGHPFPRTPRSRRLRGNIGDVGGPFYTVKRYALVPPSWSFPSGPIAGSPDTLVSGSGFCPIVIPYSYFSVSPLSDQDAAIYNGGGHLKLSASYWPPIPSVDLDALGTTAIARCKPTNSPANLAQLVTETAREGIPAMIGAKASKDLSAKSLAEEHLNYQFGIKPVVNDVQKAARALATMDNTISQFERDAGRLVRRKYRFPVVQKTETTKITGLAPVANVLSYGWCLDWDKLEIVRERTTIVRTWFSGAFTYALPKGMNSRSVLGEMRLRADRLGVEPSLKTIWEVAPWSWAVDWFSNTGDVISNVSDLATYGLVLKYGYVMHHTKVFDTYSMPSGYFYDVTKGKRVSALPPTTLVSEEKRRIPATPFGFGVNTGSLSGMQYSILAALGIARR